MARRTRRGRSRNEKIIIVVGILVVLSMVLGTFAASF